MPLIWGTKFNNRVLKAATNLRVLLSTRETIKKQSLELNLDLNPVSIIRHPLQETIHSTYFSCSRMQGFSTKSQFTRGQKSLSDFAQRFRWWDRTWSGTLCPSCCCCSPTGNWSSQQRADCPVSPLLRRGGAQGSILPQGHPESEEEPTFSTITPAAPCAQEALGAAAERALRSASASERALL